MPKKLRHTCRSSSLEKFFPFLARCNCVVPVLSVVDQLYRCASKLRERRQKHRPMKLDCRGRKRRGAFYDGVGAGSCCCPGKVPLVEHFALQIEDALSWRRRAFKPYKNIDASPEFCEGGNEERCTWKGLGSVSEAAPNERNVIPTKLEKDILGTRGFGDCIAWNFENLHMQEGEDGGDHLHVPQPWRIDPKGKRRLEFCQTTPMDLRTRKDQKTNLKVRLEPLIWENLLL